MLHLSGFFMTFLTNPHSIIMLMAMAAAVVSLAAPRPTVSNFALLIEIALISIYFYLQFGSSSNAFGFCLVFAVMSLAALGANVYLEKALPVSQLNISRVSVVVGFCLLFLFLIADHTRFSNILKNTETAKTTATIDSFFIISTIFIISSTVISAIILLNHKRKP
jgi:hypothetical protein